MNATSKSKEKPRAPRYNNPRNPFGISTRTAFDSSGNDARRCPASPALQHDLPPNGNELPVAGQVFRPGAVQIDPVAAAGDRVIKIQVL